MICCRATQFDDGIVVGTSEQGLTIILSADRHFLPCWTGLVFRSWILSRRCTIPESRTISFFVVLSACLQRVDFAIGHVDFLVTWTDAQVEILEF